MTDSSDKTTNGEPSQALAIYGQMISEAPAETQQKALIQQLSD